MPPFLEEKSALEVSYCPSLYEMLPMFLDLGDKEHRLECSLAMGDECCVAAMSYVTTVKVRDSFKKGFLG